MLGSVVLGYVVDRVAALLASNPSLWSCSRMCRITDLVSSLAELGFVVSLMTTTTPSTATPLSDAIRDDIARVVR